jgi:CRP/FNR family transcriptional regulator, dissimilatory nitrate respiration regulator
MPWLIHCTMLLCTTMNPASSLRDSAVIYSLKETLIFSGLADEHLARVASYATTHTLNKNEYLFHEGDEAVGFYLVRKGVINVHRVAADGREQVIHIFRAGESLAEAALVSSTGYPANARAEANSEVILIPRHEFMKHQKEHPDLAWRMLASMSQHLHILVSMVENLKLKDVETRFLHWLLRHCPQPLPNHEVEIELGMAKAVLAAELSTRQETLSRIFAKLRDAEHIKIQQNSITITNPQNLQQLFEKQLSSAAVK